MSGPDHTFQIVTAIALVCAIALGGYVIRRGLQSIGPQVTFRQVTRSAVVLGGLVGIVLGLTVGLLVGGILGGAFVGALLHSLLRIPESISVAIGLVVFVSGAVALASLAGTWCGKLLGRGIARAARCVAET